MGSFLQGVINKMYFPDLVEGPLLWISFIVLAAGILTRLCFFIMAVVNSGPGKVGLEKNGFAIVGRSLVPFHDDLFQKPGVNQADKGRCEDSENGDLFETVQTVFGQTEKVHGPLLLQNLDEYPVPQGNRIPT